MSIRIGILIFEFIGTAVLLIAVVGSSFMAAKLTSDKALALLIVGAVTAAVLAIIITSGVEVSGAHFNPIVTISKWMRKEMAILVASSYIVAQFLGAIFGVAVANVMFGKTVFSASTVERFGAGQFIGEIIATSGLVYLALTSGNRNVSKLIPLWIFGAYFFTPSTSFANPAATIARSFTEAPSGISHSSIASFIIAQSIGMVAVVLALRSNLCK